MMPYELIEQSARPLRLCGHHILWSVALDPIVVGADQEVRNYGAVVWPVMFLMASTRVITSLENKGKIKVKSSWLAAIATATCRLGTGHSVGRIFSRSNFPQNCVYGWDEPG